MILPKLPHRWNKRGDLPKVDPRQATSEELLSFDEDMLQIEDSTHKYVIDIGWYPAGVREGRFVAKLIVDNEWHRPVESVETRDVMVLRAWLKHEIERVKAYVGQPGQFTTRVGVFVYRKPLTKLQASKARPMRADQYVAPSIAASNSATQRVRHPRTPGFHMPVTTSARPYQPMAYAA